MKHPHGVFDNLQTNRRERWFNGELRFHVENQTVNGITTVEDYFGRFGRSENSEPWKTYPDLPLAELPKELTDAFDTFLNRNKV